MERQEQDRQRVNEVKKYFDKVDRENMQENEYNRTEITEHTLVAAQKKTETTSNYND